MTIHIASMKMRGAWALSPPDCLKLNVTSMQRKDNKNRIDFSPMTNTNYKGFWCFENYWQSGKVHKNIKHEISKSWWKKQQRPKRRYPKQKEILYSKFDHINEKLGYIKSRKLVYVPEYYNLIKDKPMVKYWKNQIKHGANIVIYDFDGPKTDDGTTAGGAPTSIELSLDLLKRKINDPKYPFGHGYIVAGLLANIHYLSYIK